MLPMQHVEKDMLYMKVADSIYNYIIDNDLQPGHKLPSEREMAKNLNIGRASLREAVRILEHEGILQVKVGIGTFVASTTENNSIYQKLFKGNYFEILDIRQVLEKEGIRRLISNCTDELLDEMEQTIIKMEDIASENIYPHADDKYFHQMIFRSSNNKSLEKMASDLSNILEEYSNVYPDASTCFIKTIPFHRALFEAIKKRNLEDAFEAYAEIVSLDREILNMLVVE